MRFIMVHPSTWRTRDGSEIRISHMSIAHIRACIGMIIDRKGRWRIGQLPFLVAELGQREMG